MKKFELIFNVVLVPVDFVMIVLANSIAYFLRYETIVKFKPALGKIDFFDFIILSFLFSIVCVIIFAILGLYDLRIVKKVDEYYKILIGISAGFVLAIVFIFLNKEFFSSRFIILSAWVLCVIFVILGRSIIRFIRSRMFNKGIGVYREIIIGNNKSKIISNEIESNPACGFKVIKKIELLEKNADIYKIINELRILKEKDLFDEVILTDPALPRIEILKLAEFCDDNNIIFKFVPDILGTHMLNYDIRTIGGIPIIELIKTPLEGWGKVAKRIMDFLGSIFLIILFSPIMAVVGIAIKIDSKGPVFYRNERVGKDGKIIELFKFRSMKKEHCIGNKYGGEKAKEVEDKLITERNLREGPLYKIKDDPRITKVGKFIRKYSIDEIPQFFNVFKGEISLVGPRPHTPREVSKYPKEFYKKVSSIKPGVTGLAQISGRSDLDFKDEAKLDTYYIENWTMLKDLNILLLTPFKLFSRRKAL